MRQEYLTILENRPLTEAMWKLVLRGNVDAVITPEQFVNLKLDGLYLRRGTSSLA